MIFRKSREENAAEQAAEPPSSHPDVPEAEGDATPEAVGEAGISVLTADVVMEGNLVTSGELLLDGTIHGAVQAARITIDTNGAINGQVVATEVLVRGRVIGPICGVRVHLVPGAQVEGDVMSQSIVVEDGAFIDGQIRHSEDPLGEWQQMWYGEEGVEGEEEASSEVGAADDAMEGYAPPADYLRPATPAEEPAEEAVEESSSEFSSVTTSEDEEKAGSDKD